MHADKTNRTMLILLAVLLIAAGAAGLVAGFGVLGAGTRHGALTHNRIGAFIGRNGDWLWPVVALVALVIVYLALRWLFTLLTSTDRSGDLPVRSDGDGSIRGRTTLGSSAVTSAVTEEIGTYRGVQSARARIIGDAEDPTLAVGVTLEQTADLAGLRHRIETEALTHARQALDKPELPILLDLAITTKRATRTA